jgi:hypothetical protein
MQIGHQRIDDDQGHLEVANDLLQDGDVARDGEGSPERAAVGDGEERDDALGIAAGGVDAGADGVVQIVLGGENHHAARCARRAAGEGLAAGEASGELAEQGGFAEAGIAVEDGDLAGGEAAGGEPVDGVGGDPAQAHDVAEGFAPGCCAIVGDRFGVLLR